MFLSTPSSTSGVDDRIDPILHPGTFPRAAIDALADAGVLGLTVPLAHGGPGAGLRVAAEVVRRLSVECGSTAMIVAMHYSAVALLAHVGHGESLKAVAAGEHLTTLAFSEAGSRRHFWTPVSSATAESDGRVRLDARKSWVTAAHEADSYVWSSRPASEPGPMTLWYVPTTTDGLHVDGTFDGLGLRGNDSCPVTADGVVIPAAARLGDDGVGLDLALSVVLPWFLTLNAAASIGLMEAVTASTAQHLTGTRLTHLNQSLAQQLPGRTRLAQARIESDRNRALLEEAVAAVESERDDAPLLVLEVKASADAGSSSVTDLAMVACGGAAFRRESPVERRFRDSRAARVMAPTTDALHDFIGRALTGLPLLDPPADTGTDAPGEAGA
ncbi:acyl-CoA/acyl-ACP dehydrogenase [Gordonia sp. TBRC 11910]|uniref:Acyl-CoA/acyl-ACP dehydrogenase n=1 Tax=Gordonia asplenii TaxID=2725283 RepID=A0A848KW35_9ACTN|nr:acyl-CoA dehydrogenase family protein [Gordonia asplenii]NMN99677.1 acyl-CoA/acyl-ACP dehydrogenase [Gordonia asplenii]